MEGSRVVVRCWAALTQAYLPCGLGQDAVCSQGPGHSCSWERPGLSLLGLHEYSLSAFPELRQVPTPFTIRANTFIKCRTKKPSVPKPGSAQQLV